MADYKSHGMKKGMDYGHGNKKIGTPKSANSASDASNVKEKTSGGKSSKSATSYRTY